MSGPDRVPPSPEERLAEALQSPGRASVPYADPSAPNRALVLECYRPANHAPDSPVVLVQHGMKRNGDEYRDAWVPAADRHGLLVVATTFPQSDWPGSRPYNDGDVLEEDGSLRPRDRWSTAIPGRVLGLLRRAGVTAREKAYLWGHSAGGQFVHRLMATQPALHGMFEAVGTANAGWYTLPTLDPPYPEGLGGIGLDQENVGRLLGFPMVVFAGDQDLLSENLPMHEAAVAQGPHRFARAAYYVARGQAEAARLSVPCRWQLVTMPSIGHEGARMADAAAAHWFDGPASEASPVTGSGPRGG